MLKRRALFPTVNSAERRFPHYVKELRRGSKLEIFNDRKGRLASKWNGEWIPRSIKYPMLLYGCPWWNVDTIVTKNAAYLEYSGKKKTWGRIEYNQPIPVAARFKA